MTLSIATSIDDVLTGLANGARPIAGGTDLVVGARAGKAALPDTLIAIDRLAELATIDHGESTTRIGSGVTHARLITSAIVVDNFTAIADAAALVGSPATRNVGTLGGNVMNASPAMDTGSPLVVLGAEVELTSTQGSRQISLEELWTGPGRTSARADELCTALIIPNRGTNSGSAYIRLEYRRSMEIAIVGAAAAVQLEGDSIASIRIALTAVAPTIIEVTDLDDLIGSTVGEVTLASIAARASEQAAPISDVRASDRYRRHTIGVMARRAVEAAGRRAAGEIIAVPVNRALGVGAAS
ncbi:MAG: CO/xanthine dehydrogenase FAD-binding subunit [Verrucomicrobiales bacterium]|jgi:CO/xanthine dehydrogenase FAD-binding subunit